MKALLRRAMRWSHIWLGLITGLFLCLMAVSGGLVALRPPLAMLLSPPSPRAAGCAATDWDRAAHDISTYAGAEINRIYGPDGTDTKYHIRTATDSPILFGHVIFDACSGKVLGSIPFQWMDWTVDLHHNLLAGKTGRLWTGAIGVAMLVSGLSGLLLWLMARPSWKTAFTVSLRLSNRSPREWHRAAGLAAMLFLTGEAFSGLWLSFPQTMRGLLATVSTAPETVRPARAPKDSGSKEHIGLGAIMAAAKQTFPDGMVREVRMPEGGGSAQVRMWRPGDFRSLGNNVVFVSSVTGKVMAVDKYGDRSGSSRIVQAMAALHYDEWGGTAFRILAAAAGFSLPLLYITGFFLWRQSRVRKPIPANPARSREVAAIH